jgi:hypothetical protein
MKEEISGTLWSRQTERAVGLHAARVKCEKRKNEKVWFLSFKAGGTAGKSRPGI